MSEDSGTRSLADQLRGWPDEQVSRLLTERPDLATPAPNDFGQLASRAAVRSSIARALDILTRFELFVLDALVVGGQTSRPELHQFLRARASSVDAALDRLQRLALVWESRSGLRPLSAVASAMSGGAAHGMSGLRPRTEDPPDAATVSRLLEELSPGARALLEHVVEQGGEATSGAARLTISTDEATSPPEELIARRLLVARGGVLVVPGEVGMVLRGGCTTAQAVDEPPVILTADRDQTMIDRAAAGAAFELVRRIELLLDIWGTDPPGELRSGGLGVRDLRATATHLHVETSVAALLVEMAAEAGLLATRADADGAPVWVPTDAFDQWIGQDLAARWESVARAWLASNRQPGLVGTRDPAGKAHNALSRDLTGHLMSEVRTLTLQVLDDLDAGQVLAAGTGSPSVVARVLWQRPRRPRSRADQVAWTLQEASMLGLTGLGGLSVFARRLLAGEDPTSLLTHLLPTSVDHLLIQADLTAIAPGPLESALARRVQLIADVESRGGATVYRFTSRSVRRALDVGWSGAEVHEFLSTVSRTPVPQPLSYLVDDVVRTFGAIRVGHAEAFLRADDETALTELFHHPAAASLGLHRIAPTVLISASPLEVLLPRLRDLGASPVVEAADGTVRISRPDVLRARTPRQRRPTTRAAGETARLASAVAAMRAGDRVAASLPESGTATTPSAALAALREAVEAEVTVVIGYVDNHGASSDRVVDPRGVEGGRLSAFDHRAQGIREFSVHRITSVTELASS